MERIVFASLAKPNYRYTWHKSGYRSPIADYRNHGLADNCGWFDTYGDGETQHSAEAAVGLDWACDYFASLLKCLAESTDPAARDAMLECLDGDWPKLYMARAEFTFAMSVKHKPGKQQYYSKEDRKVSGAESKRHDRRWEEVTERQDGSPRSAFAILCSGRCDRLHNYLIALELADVWRDENGQTIAYKDCAQLCGMVADDTDGDWDGNHKLLENANNLHTGFVGVDYFVKAWRLFYHGRRSWECLENNYCRNVLRHGLDEEVEPVEGTAQEPAPVEPAAEVAA